jgi:hypothetical protein
MARKVGVDGELVPRGVVAGGLTLELAERAGAVPAGVPVSVTASLRTRPGDASNRCQWRSHITRPTARSPSLAIASRAFTVSSRRWSSKSDEAIETWALLHTITDPPALRDDVLPGSRCRVKRHQRYCSL